LRETYINDELDFSNFTLGYRYRSREVMDKYDGYIIQKHQYVSIGNAGGTAAGSSADGSDILESFFENNDNDVGGVYFNREFAKVLEAYNEKFIFYDDPYGQNSSLTKQITYDDIRAVIKYCNRYNSYNFFTNNCVSIAVGSWNRVFPNDTFTDLVAPGILKIEIMTK
jgi:hypothetical protein